MHGRFARSPRAELECPNGTIEVVVADSARVRLLGLMRLDAGDVEPLLFPGCRSIHMRFMKTPIDLVWLEVDGVRARVIGAVGGLEPGGTTRCTVDGANRRLVAALELVPGVATRLGIAPDAVLELSAPG